MGPSSCWIVMGTVHSIGGIAENGGCIQTYFGYYCWWPVKSAASRLEGPTLFSFYARAYSDLSTQYQIDHMIESAGEMLGNRISRYVQTN